MVGSLGDILRHPKLNHSPQVLGGILEDECAAMVTEFFESRRTATP
jgi:tRNA(adenine34) deaminase